MRLLISSFGKRQPLLFLSMAKQKQKNSFEKIYQVIQNIPNGKICTYGIVARMAGLGSDGRMVSYALHSLSENSPVPWHRVINRFGKISWSISRNGHDQIQYDLLKQEGIVFAADGSIDFKKFLWTGNDFE